MLIAADIPSKQFDENHSVFIFPKENKYIVAPSGALTYYKDYIELPDHTKNKDTFMVSLFCAYCNIDQLIEIAKEMSQNIN